METANIDHQALRDTLAAIEFRHQNQLLGDPVLTFGTDADKCKVSAFHYRLQGKEYYKAAADDIASSSPATTTSVQFRKDIVAIDSAGTITLIQGTAATSQALAELPDIPVTKLGIGYIEVQNSFTNESTDLVAGNFVKLTSSIDVTYT
jgi:hypothetical protein